MPMTPLQLRTTPVPFCLPAQTPVVPAQAPRAPSSDKENTQAEAKQQEPAAMGIKLALQEMKDSYDDGLISPQEFDHL